MRKLIIISLALLFAGCDLSQARKKAGENVRKMKERQRDD